MTHAATTTTSAPPSSASAQASDGGGVRTPRWAGLGRLVSPLLLLSLWELLSRSGVIPPHVIGAPSSIADALVGLVASGELFRHFLVSLQRAASGLAIGLAIGVGAALVAGLSRLGEAAVDPPMQMLRTLPFLGVIPLFIVWFGIGEVTKIALIALATKTPVYLTLYGGIRGVDHKLVEAAGTLGLSRIETILHVILPGALPAFFVGLRYALGISLLALVAVEQINASAGIGYLINEARDFMRTDVIVVCLLIYCLLGLVTDALVRALERRALAWRPSIVG
ncbi:ABC transporter permease [Thauera sinica]|uniref:ABC transporter permease n=1 Tax=Thauera sinica TaxID=2665146 RepID=A0ABW1AMP4_9RHOO|nr:ABC transporter permease [Thauera sp. K11]ATE60698.1 ABC transporter permease [Thauera sp. K11]